MTAIGTTVTPSECLQHLRSPSLLFRGLISVLVIVPLIGFATTSALNLTLPEQVGVVLMAIAPGAPLALRRALASGGDAGFAPTLQITIAVLAVPAVPLWVLIGNWILGTHGMIDASAVARQVFLAQLLPLAMGSVVKRLAPVIATKIGWSPRKCWRVSADCGDHRHLGERSLFNPTDALLADPERSDHHRHRYRGRPSIGRDFA